MFGAIPGLDFRTGWRAALRDLAHICATDRRRSAGRGVNSLLPEPEPWLMLGDLTPPGITTLRKLIEFDDDTFAKLKQLARDRMATFQELADEAFADLMKKHGIPIDLKDALRKSAAASKAPASATPKRAKSGSSRKAKS